MKTPMKSFILSVNFLFALGVSQLSFAQRTPEQWFEFFNNGISGEDARQPGANDVDVTACKAFMEENPDIFPNLGKCANSTPADLQFICNNPVIQDLLLTDSKGDCVRFMMAQMSEKKRSSQWKNS